MTHDVSGWSWREFWLGLDRWLNTWFGGRSLETISSRAGRAHMHWWAAILCRFLSLFDRDHCAKASHAEHPAQPQPAPLTKKELDALRRLHAKATRRRPPRVQERPPEVPPQAP